MALLAREINVMLDALSERDAEWSASDKERIMSAELLESKYPICDQIKVPEHEIENWQATVDLLAEIAHIPAALVMRVHASEIEVFVSSQTPGNVYHSGERATLNTGLYCETVMSTQRELLVPNALIDPDWNHNPDIELGMISYCGLPLTWPTGEIFGTICVLDKKENTFNHRIQPLMARFRDSIQLSLANIYESSLARKKAEEALAQQNEALLKLNHFSIDLSMLSLEEDLERLIARQIKEISGAEVSIFSEYNPANRTTTPQYIELKPGLLDKVVHLLGTQVKNIHSVVSDEMYREMTADIIGVRRTLSEAAFGAIPPQVGKAIQALLKVDRFIGTAYLIEGKLYGTSLLGMRKDQPDPPRIVLENFIFLAASALRRKQAEKALKNNQRLLAETEKMGKVGGWEFDIVTQKQTWTEEVYRIHEVDFTDNQTVDQGLNFYTPASRPIIEQAVQRAIEQGEPFDVELEIVTAKGNLRMVHAIGKADLEYHRVFGFFQDITDRKRAEQSLRLHTERVQVLLKLNQMTDVTHQELTDYALEEAVRITHSEIGYLAFLNDDETVLSMHSWSKQAMKECAILDKPIQYVVTETGLWGEAVRQRRPVITNDYAAPNPAKKGHPQGHVPVRRHMNVPVFAGKHIVLVAGVGNKEGEYDNSDAEQLTLLMEGMWRLIERKKAEEELHKSKDYLKEAQRIAHLGSWYLDVASNQVVWSEELYQMYGFDPALPPPPYTEHQKLFTTESWARLSTALPHTQDTGIPYELELELLRKDGSQGWMWVRGEAVLDTSGATVGLRGVALDITERKQAEEQIKRLNTELEQRVADRTVQFQTANRQLESELAERELTEEALRESEERFRRLSEAAFEAINIHDGGVLLDANEKYYAMFGFKPKELMGKQVMSLTIAPEAIEAVKKEIATGGVGPYESTGLRKDGTRFPMEIRVRGLEYKGRKVRMAAIMDITERKRAEQALQQRAAQLEAANKELEAFSYSVSHDLRAPLRGIDGWSLALMEDYGSQLDGQAKTYLERVRSEAQRMGQLIDDLLQLSRLTSTEMNPRKVNLSALAGTIAVRLQKAEPERKVEFVIQPRLSANGDARLLEIALTNLLDNAFKFTGKTPRARIQFGQTEVEGRRAFFVGDNGAGFDMALAKKLFGAFQRMHKTSDFPGTGVGLTTVQRIVHRHGGRIWAEAAVDQGATFYFTIEEIP